MSKSVVDRLSHLIMIEREALLAGDLDAVGALAEEKEGLAQALEKVNSAELQALSSQLDHNGRLLAAAREGVVAVLTTLKNQREARSSLASYDSTGKATQISPVGGGTERRF